LGPYRALVSQLLEEFGRWHRILLELDDRMLRIGVLIGYAARANEVIDSLCCTA
jgi:hypothetical protein